MSPAMRPLAGQSRQEKISEARSRGVGRERVGWPGLFRRCDRKLLRAERRTGRKRDAEQREWRPSRRWIQAEDGDRPISIRKRSTLVDHMRIASELAPSRWI